ncbi:MAG TPA: acetyl-CoA hydrolase/transferase C-terminal domain-containing protein, partial [Fluviicoccus sp.]|nr:acetyl-CoA hydrolase/transferase C-terminal domain-containing protein [Fluviicoccus sp.]
LVDESEVDAIVSDPACTHTIFSAPNMKVDLTDYAIGMYVSSLVKDGGTLQIGIGSLGDAIAHSLIMRQHDNANYTTLIRRLNQGVPLKPDQETTPLVKGLYGCSEMFVNGFLKLMQAGIIRKPVYGHAGLQTLLNQGLLTDKVTPHTLRILREHGLIASPLDGDDISFLVRFGIFHEDCTFEDGQLHAGETVIGNDLDDSDVLQGIIAHCLGQQLTGGIIMHGGFFLGPRDFYDTLRGMSEPERERICMSSITFINHLYGDRYGDEKLKRAQRAKARFINTCMMTTLAGAHVSDGLENGKVVSGVGGQYNFVAQAHELPDGRSVLMMRSHRMVDGEVKSNIVTHYGHITIPRHLRDILVTEYGIADLRAKNDSDIIKALLNVTDSRCQEELREWAVAQGKLSADYIIPKIYRDNTPESLAARLEPFQASLPAFPFGTDFTKDELAIVKALMALKASTENPLTLVKSVINSVFKDHEVPQRYLERMGLEETHSLKERVMRRLFMGNF